MLKQSSARDPVSEVGFRLARGAYGFAARVPENGNLSLRREWSLLCPGPARPRAALRVGTLR